MPLWLEGGGEPEPVAKCSFPPPSPFSAKVWGAAVRPLPPKQAGSGGRARGPVEGAAVPPPQKKKGRPGEKPGALWGGIKPWDRCSSPQLVLEKRALGEAGSDGSFLGPPLLSSVPVVDQEGHWCPGSTRARGCPKTRSAGRRPASHVYSGGRCPKRTPQGGRSSTNPGGSEPVGTPLTRVQKWSF